MTVGPYLHENFQTKHKCKFVKVIIPGARWGHNKDLKFYIFKIVGFSTPKLSIYCCSLYQRANIRVYLGHQQTGMVPSPHKLEEISKQEAQRPHHSPESSMQSILYCHWITLHVNLNIFGSVVLEEIFKHFPL
jgi:hypothetical protein